jgi:hypothetical protein
MIRANVFAVLLATFAVSGLDGCFQQEKDLDTKDDEACRREATIKRNAPHERQQSY